MKNVTGESIWSNLNSVVNKYSYLSENIECDVVIVGAGVTGALCSYYFTRENVNTVILDKNIIGYGSTRASTAILQYEIDKDLVGLSGLIGYEKAVECFKEVQNSLYELKDIVKDIDDDCDFTIKDCLYYTNKKNEINFFKKEFEYRQRSGFNVEFLSFENSENMFSFDIQAGIYSKKLAGEIDPYKLTHSILRKGLQRGLRIYENTKVSEIKSNNNGVKLYTKNGFSVKAKKVIIATGYDARLYFDKKTALLSRSFNIVTKPVSNFNGWYNKCIIRNSEQYYTYIRGTNDNRIIIGGEDEKLGGERSKMYNLEQDDTLSKNKYNILYDKLLSYFPKINDLEIEFSFSGFFGETKDGLPYIGTHKKYKNHYFCLAYGSNGILYALIGAKVLRDIYFGKKSNIMELVKLDR